MNSSENKVVKKKKIDAEKLAIASIRVLIVILVVVLTVFLVYSVNCCERRDREENYFKFNVALSKLPLKETPLLLDSLLFDDEKTKDIDLIIYYNYPEEINKRKIDNIPLSNCIFTGEPYVDYYKGADTIKDQVFIYIQDSLIGNSVYTKGWKVKDIANYIKKHPNVNYKIYGDELTIAKYIGIKRKAR